MAQDAELVRAWVQRAVAAMLRERAEAERRAGDRRPDLRSEFERSARALSAAADDVEAGLFGDDAGFAETLAHLGIAARQGEVLSEGEG